MKSIQSYIENYKSKEIFRIVLQLGTASKHDLLDRTSLTSSTLTRLLEELTAQGLLLEMGYGESTGGRKPILYQVNPNFGYTFGLEISRTISRLILTDLHYNQLEYTEWSMTGEMTPQRLVEKVSDALHVMLEKHQLTRDHVLGIGVGAVGPVDRTSGMILEPLYFPNSKWHHVSIRDLLQSAIGIPAVLDNGANTALLGEYGMDDHKVDNSVLVHVGVSLRSSVMSMGSLTYGSFDVEGAIGQMIIQTDGVPPRVPEGNHGALESYASLYAIEKQVKAAMKRGLDTIVSSMTQDPDQVSMEMIQSALAQEDRVVTSIAMDSAAYLGIGLSNLLNTLHPEKVYLCGPYMSLHPVIYETAIRVAVERTLYYPTYNVSFSPGCLGERALVIGAAMLVTDELTRTKMH